MNSGTIWNQNTFITLLRSGVWGKIPTQHISLQAIKTMNQVILLMLGNPLKTLLSRATAKEHTAAACTVSMEFYKICYSLFTTYKQPAKQMGREVLPWTTNYWLVRHLTVVHRTAAELHIHDYSTSQWLSADTHRSWVSRVLADTFIHFVMNTFKCNPYDGKIGIL